MTDIDFKVTDQAWEFLDNQISEPYLEISLKVSGCSGYAYEFQPRSSKETSHLCVSKHKYSLQVLLKHEDFDKCFKGATLCLYETTFGSQIKIQNPNVSDSCGCGESFTLDGDS